MKDYRDIIPKGLVQWHEFVEKKDDRLLSDLLDEECVFYSPVVYAPQKGKGLTFMYLKAAMTVFESGNFRYVSEVKEGPRAVLEFECLLDETWINGVDIIEFNEEGHIVAFKVMIRPMRAVLFLKELMFKALQNNVA